MLASSFNGVALEVRSAGPEDIAAIVELSSRVQEKLSAQGSLQQFGPLAVDFVTRQVEGGTAHVLAGDRIVGSVFVEPLTEYLVPIDRWGLRSLRPPLWFLEKLMIDPDEQGKGLGAVLLDGVRADLASRGAITVVLDCWAGNDKLREFYERNGFTLHGVFPTLSGEFELAVFLWRSSSSPSPRAY